MPGVDPIAMLGAASAMLGLAGTSVACQVGREVVSMPRLGRHPTDWAAICGLAMIVAINLLLVAGGTAMAVFGFGGLAA